MLIKVKKDGDGFLAEVKGCDYLYAYGDTKQMAKKKLLGVIEMMMDYHLELVEKERGLRNDLLQSKELNHAI